MPRETRMAAPVSFIRWFGRRGDGTASALDDRLRGRCPMVRVVSLALIMLGCLTVPVRSQPRGEPADPPKGQRVFFASHSGMWYVPDPLGELAESAKIKGHKTVGLQKVAHPRLSSTGTCPRTRTRPRRP